KSMLAAAALQWRPRYKPRMERGRRSSWFKIPYGLRTASPKTTPTTGSLNLHPLKTQEFLRSLGNQHKHISALFGVVTEFWISSSRSIMSMWLIFTGVLEEAGSILRTGRSSASLQRHSQ